MNEIKCAVYDFENPNFGDLNLIVTSKFKYVDPYIQYSITQMPDIATFLRRYHFDLGEDIMKPDEPKLAWASNSQNSRTRYHYLHSLYVNSYQNCKGKKLGSQMIYGMANHLLKNSHFTELIGYSLSDAVEFYKKLGFTMCGENGQDFTVDMTKFSKHSPEFRFNKQKTDWGNEFILDNLKEEWI